jgi:hypothetical protein
LLTLFGCLALAVWVFGRSALRSDKDDVLAYLPADALFLATVDLVAAHRSGLLESFGKDTLESAGARRIRSVCGFDPVEPLRALGVAAGHAGSGGLDFAIIAAGDFGAERIAACAEKMIVAQGGTPRRAKMGSFSSVHDESRTQAGVVAVRQGGPVLLGSRD